MTIKVLVADDQDLVRAGFCMIIDARDDLEVVGEAGDGDQAVREAARLRPDVVLMDVRMPGTDGIAATRLITAAADPPKVTGGKTRKIRVDGSLWETLSPGDAIVKRAGSGPARG